MATRKTKNFLPTVFQTDTNQKFLSATMDQLVSEPNLTDLYGYIGRTFAPTAKSGDSYIKEPTTERQDYQLEPSIVVRDKENNINFFASYTDLLDQISYYGGLTNNHSRLWEQEYYTFDPLVSYDKLVNFSQYYWMPDGPDVVDVNTTGVELSTTYTVTRDATTNRMMFTSNGEVNYSLTLARGGTYNFVVDQPGFPLWIQTDIGTSGNLTATSTISSRSVLGVTNNGIDVGTITFNVPQSNAQDRWVNMQTVSNVDYATPVPYNTWQNKTVSQFVAEYPQYNGIVGQLDGKTLVFVNNAQFGDASWVNPVVHDNYGNVVAGYNAGQSISAAPTGNLAATSRYGIWQVVLVDAGIKTLTGATDLLIQLIPIQNVNINQKVYVRYGVVNANKEFYKDYDGYYYQQPLLSAALDQLYFQDGVSSLIYDPVRIVEFSGWNIDVEKDILGKKNYTSPNGVQFTTGLKIQFSTDVTPTSYQNNQFYVEEVGSSGGIRLVPVSELVTPEAYNTENAKLYPGQLFPDYITINRSSVDRNAWSRNNRWFHVDVITATAKYNNTIPMFDQQARGQRPIVQFDADTLLFNSGRIGLAPIDILDTSTVDAFLTLEGQTYETAFGVTLTDGMRVIFAADQDPLVKDKIYVLNLVQYSVDSYGNPTGPQHIQLTKAADGDVTAYDTVVVKNGNYAGSQWWFDGANWNSSQQKTNTQQPPLFEVLDPTGKSFSSYTRSTFAGTQLFGYLINSAGFDDTILGFPLTYRNFSTQGDIEFQNYFNTDTFTFVDDAGTVTTAKVDLGYLQVIQDAENLMQRNTWLTVPEHSKQYQQITYTYDGTNSPFQIDVTPNTSSTIPYVKVFQNFTYLTSGQWTLADNAITLTTTPAIGDQIVILVYSDEVSSLGYYQVPLNLDLNAQNIDINTLTLGQLRNHLVALSQNSTVVTGNILGASNLRDVEIKSQGGTLLQHSAPAPYSMFLIDDKANLVKSLRYAQQEYIRFKNKFLELSVNLAGIDPENVPASVDMILTKINSFKNKTFPWYYSDMVPYGPLKSTLTYTVFDPLVTNYQLSSLFNDQVLSNRAVLVYINGVQAINNQDFEFSLTTPSVTFLTTLNVGDVITINDYSNTDGNYIPETPTKLGLWPPYVPEIFADNTYRTPTNVIRGHDGSITPAFGDYRDAFLLELELRIFNNIKLPDTGTYQDILSVIPGKFRKNVVTESFSNAEANQLLSPSFMSWIGNNKLDFSTNSTFQANDAFTWNYSSFQDRLDGEQLPGSWRACYQYFYDTFRPHITPWEMLGFATMPSWWLSYYGPGPYTGANALLWADLEAGNIVQGIRQGVDLNYARPGLSKIIPVDANGNLLSPVEILTKSINSERGAGAWAVGNYGPVEFAWRSSSEFPYAVQIAIALAKPGKYFGQLMDTYNYTTVNSLYSLQDTATGQIIGSEQYLTRNTNHHITQDQIDFNGDVTTGTPYRGAGYINFIADYLISLGVNPATYMMPMLTKFQVNLAYKAAGFTDQKYLQVLAEQVSPTSTNASILIPNENYKIYLNETPVSTKKLSYSAVIVEKTTNGYSVRGYDLNTSYFTIIPSVVNSNAQKLTVLNSSAVIFNNYQNLKLRVPYGFEFTSQQQVADFLVGYQRYLIAQGFTFEDLDPNLGKLRNWQLSVEEFLYWSQQGWTPGSIIVLSPVADTLNAVTSGAITEGIQDNQFGSKVLDQNFKLVKNNNYSVLRTPTNFKVTLTDPASVIGFVEVDLVQFEHALIFDNVTVFNDVIYQPETGNRQYRLKLQGQKTAAWDGSLTAPGFVYSSGQVSVWDQGKDYLQGDLVSYKNKYYTALQNVIANPTFQFQYWTQIKSSQIQTGLLPNFSTLAVEAQSYYDSYGVIKDKDNLDFSHSLIGFKPRQYLSDLGLTETTQIEFYKGFIAQKGSANAVNQMLRAKFNNISSDINFYEEWAIRVGEYGALDSNPFVEVPLNEHAFGVNPSVLEFVGAANNNLGNGVTIFNQNQLYKSYGAYDANVALVRTSSSDYTNDIPTAGYVNINDVDLTIYDLANYVDLDGNINNMGSGYLIWCAKDFTQNWNVYRITETNNFVIGMANSLNNYITFTTKEPHNLVAGTKTTEGSVFLVKGFDAQFDGFYQVYQVVDQYNVMVKFAGSLANITTLTGHAIMFRLDSMRFTYMEDSRIYGLSNPPNGWKVGDKIWIDSDAATTAVQGQPFSPQPSNTWKVYEKQHPWSFDQELTKNSSEYATGDGFGTSVKMSADGLVIVAGSPTAQTTGTVSTFLRDHTGNYVEGTLIVPIASNTAGFGQTVDLATDATSNDTLAVGAPASASGNGYVYIYNKSISSSLFTRGQVIVGNVGDSFGSSIAFNQDGEWLYVGAPGNNSVYAYGLNRFVPFAQQVVSVNNQNTLVLDSTITVTAGQILTQPATGATATILQSAVSSSSILVSTLTNFVNGATVTFSNVTVLANVYLNGADTSLYPTGNAYSATTNTINLTFTPAVPGDANSLLITNDFKTFIPGIDYTLSGSTVSFAANIAQSTVSIIQQPYYTLLNTITIPTGNSWAKFGYALSSSFDGAQIAIGAPGDTVMGANNTLLAGAGSVYVYDRVIEAFNTTDGTTYTTKNNIATVYKVLVDDLEVNNYVITGANTIEFIDPPAVGHVLFIEVNQFNLLETLVGVNSLQGGLGAIQANAAFGTTLTICSNNCAIYVGAPYFDNGTQYNSGAVWKFHNRGRLYGTNTGYQLNPTFVPGDTIRLNNFEVTVANVTTGNTQVASLNDVVTNINSAGILGVSAVNQGGYLRLNSDVTVAKDQLRILSGVRQAGSTGVYADADLRVFAYMQIITNPFGAPGEYFGTKIKLASNAYMLVIGSGKGTTKEFTTFDVETTTNGTTFDQMSTRLFDAIQGSGSVYIYELYDDPRNAVEHPGRYSFAQQIDPGTLVPGAGFGTWLDIEGTYITVTAPGATTNGQPSKSGTIYVFQNPTMARGWGLIRYQQPKVDINSLSRLYLYSNTSDTILADLEFLDPAKGRILGQAEQEITYKTEYDPAIYNQGNNPNADINANVYWGANQVGKVWWNLSQVRYVDYEQDTITYRSINWGTLFPGSVIEICEWVKSSYLPSQYVVNGGEGVPKYADDSAYVSEIYVDATTGIITNNYYYWVTGKTTIESNDPTRHMPIASIADMIANPKNQGLPYAAVISTGAIAFYNISKYLSASNTIMHLDHQLLINTDIIHSEYQLIQKGNPNDPIPTKIVNKFIDSLSGLDQIGQTVPDPALSVADRYGISVRPRQTMFIDRLTAVSELVAYVNSVLITNPIAEQFNLSGLMAQEPIPNVKLGAYDQSVDTYTELAYIDVGPLSAGYKVLVQHDSTQDGLWVLYTLTTNKTWQILQIQSYKTSLYWTYVDWYATGYSSATKPTFSVETTNDAIALLPAAGDVIYISNATGNNTWQLVIVNTNGTFSTVGIQNGTIQLDSSLGDFVNNNLGFGNQDFDSNRFDQDPNIETRAIIEALYNDIFIDTLQGQFNDLFFIMVNYLLTEQKYVDWLFKSSFISVVHKLRSLSQYPSYVVDNQTYYQDYINEVKPYRTKVREYLIDYTGEDTFGGDITDFDLPGYFDTSTTHPQFRSPSGESPFVAVDEAKWQTFPYNQWYNNRNLHVESIIVENGGYGYANVPAVSIVSQTVNGTGATAIANMTGNVGNLSVASITVVTPGYGYNATPAVYINGSANVAATAYAVLNNNLVRTFDTTIKFDRVSYTGTVQQWQANTTYSAGQIVSYAMQDGNTMIRQAYSINSNITTGSTFIPAQYTVVSANVFNNANDRILGYYEPSSGMPALNTISVPLTLANTATNTNTIYVFTTPSIVKGMYIGGQGVSAGYITGVVGNVSITLSNVVTAVSQVTLSVNVSLAVNSSISATFDGLGQLVNGVDYPGTRVNGASFNLNPSYGRTFDNSGFDSVQYSPAGPLLSSGAIDINLYSLYTDLTLGTKPEDVTADGGKFIDKNASHAPEELVPGITFDTLDMRIYTSNVVVGNVSTTIGYRIFNNMINKPSYLRIADAFTTTLSANLYLTDSNIHVTNASVLPYPDINDSVPGVVFIGSERITYWTIDVVNNVLGQIRRGTQGTGSPNVQVAGSRVVDGGLSQIMPNTKYGNAIPNTDILLNSGVGTATDGNGLNGSITTAALFLKASPATFVR